MVEIERYIAVFNRDGFGDEFLVQELPLPDIPLLELQKLFSIAGDNPMYDCYPITIANVSFFKKWVDQEFNFERYEYFLECSAKS
ncbi:MAG: hypothetical protein KDI90_00880 [Alphaproteobacteria bacterium]|nr:hypothetical protein [Alphaproteobacteria bacterium]